MPAPPTQFRIFNTTQTSVLLSWRAGFPGGPYTQVFVVEYRTPGGDWKEFTDSVSGIEGQLMVVEVTGLSAGTRYEFRVFARNTREVGNKSDYTDVLQEMTKVIPPYQNTSVGIIVGIVVAISTLTIIIIVIIVLYRKGFTVTCSFGFRKTETVKENNQEDNRAYDSIGLENNTPITVYEGLKERKANEYMGLWIYQNAKSQLDDKNQYEVLQGKTPVTYETLSGCVNEKPLMRAEDPAYQNMK